ncbi:MAG: hypothetical protein ACR65R_21070 [Methylomicrobium sp.]
MVNKIMPAVDRADQPKLTLGTTELDFTNGIVNQLIDSRRHTDQEDMDFLLSMIEGIQPMDRLEMMLAAQMVMVHNATMTLARRLAQVEMLSQQDSAERALNKLARTFTLQIEALKRYRSTGEQKVTVQHVTINDGGQAVIGDFTTGAGIHKNEDKPHAKQITDASETLPCSFETHRKAVPIPRR